MAKTTIGRAEVGDATADQLAIQKVSNHFDNIAAPAQVAKRFDLPTVLTTGQSQWPNGPTLPVLRDTFPDLEPIESDAVTLAGSETFFDRSILDVGSREIELHPVRKVAHVRSDTEAIVRPASRRHGRFVTWFAQHGDALIAGLIGFAVTSVVLLMRAMPVWL